MEVNRRKERKGVGRGREEVREEENERRGGGGRS